jgi:RimJ/RimL family protein N-acetyltransferase
MIDFGYGVTLHSLNKDSMYWYRQNRNKYPIWKWCRQNDLIDEHSHENWMKKQSEDPNIKMYEIIGSVESGDRLIGICGLTDIDRVSQRAEFSLYINPCVQNKGSGLKTLKTLFSHGFMNQNLNVIWGETFEGNHAFNLFLKIGMKHEGTRRQFYFKEGKHIDAHLISMTRKEFEEAPWKQPQQ